MKQKSTLENASAEASNTSLIDPAVLARISNIKINSRFPMEGSFSGMHKSPHRGASVEFSQFRKYSQGDDIKNLDWKIYAKTDRFYIKEFEADTNMRCHMLIDCSASMGFSIGAPSKLDICRKFAAHIAQVLVMQGDAVGLQCISDKITEDIPARSSPRHLRKIMDLLESAAPSGRTEISRLLHELAEKIRKRAMIMLFSDFFTELPPLLDCLRHMRFRKHELIVFQALAPEEIKFEFQKPTRFIDMESSDSILTDPSSIRKRYLSELGRHNDALLRACREFKADYRLLDCSRPCGDLLVEFLEARSR